MSIFGIITFHDEAGANKTYETLKTLEKEKQLTLDDAVIVTKDADGEVKVKETKDMTTKRGAAAGGTIGLVIGLVVGGPVGGALLGGAAGAFAGKKVDLGVAKGKVEAVVAALDVASSALLLKIDESHTNLDLLKAAIKQSGGEVLEVEVNDLVEVDLQDTLNGFTASGSN